MTHHVLIAIVLIAGPLAAADDSLPLQKVAVDDIRLIAEGIDDFARANNFYPGRSSRFEFVPVDSLTQDLVPDYVAVIPAFDPWGQTYWYWADGEHFIVGSGGAETADRRWRDVIARDPRGPSHALDKLCSSPGRGSVLLIDGRFCALSKDVTHGPPAGTLTGHERSVLSVEELRTIAGAVSAYEIDNNIYPVLADGVSGVDVLRPALEPNYVRVLPLSDAWGHSYFYWSNGKTFLVYSTGGDAEDQDYGSSFRSDAEDFLASTCSGPSGRPGADIVYVNGVPCTWPGGILE